MLGLGLQLAHPPTILPGYSNHQPSSPFGSAARNGQAESVRFLPELGSDPNRCDPNMIARTPLATAATTNPETVKLLLEAGADPDHS